MLGRILERSITRRYRRKLLSLTAVALGIAVTTAVGIMALDVGDKVSRELRSFGANIMVTPAADGLSVSVGGSDFRPAGAGAYLPQSDLVKLKKIFWRNNIVAFAPFLYAPVEIRGRNVVVTGSWFAYPMPVDGQVQFTTGLKSLHPAWKVNGAWPADQDVVECLVGKVLARQLGATPGSTLPLTIQGRPRDFRVTGILESGGPEDSQIFVPLATLQDATGLRDKVRRIEVSALTKPADDFARADVTRLSPADFERWYCSPYVMSISYQIQQELPGAEAKAVRQVAESEGKILSRVGVLMGLLAAAALVTAGLAVASMMLATVLERRAEIGLFKSLGATNLQVSIIFLSEALLVGVAGGLVGFGAGELLARRLIVLVFGTHAGAHWVVLPMALALALLVTLAGCVIPLGRGLKISPVVVLRNE